MLLTFFLLFHFSYAEVIHLTENSLNPLDTDPKGRPSFVYLYDPTKIPSKKIHKVENAWKNLSEGKYKNLLFFADINCHSDPNLCSKIDKPTRQRFYWLEPLNGTKVRYFGKPNIEHFRYFIKKQFNYPLQVVKPQKVKKYVENITDCVVIYFAIHPKNSTQTEIAYETTRKVAFSMRGTETQFLLIDGYEDIEPFMVVFASKFRSAVFKGQWTVHDLSNFILTRSLPLLSSVSQYNLKFLKNNSLVALVYLQSDGRKIHGDERQLLESQGSVMPILKANCEEQEWFCRYVNRYPTDQEFFYFVLDKKRNCYLEYTGIAQLQNKSILKQWLRKVLAGEMDDKFVHGNGKLGPDIEELKEVKPVYDFYNRHKKEALFTVIGFFITSGAVFAIISFVSAKRISKEK